MESGEFTLTIVICGGLPVLRITIRATGQCTDYYLNINQGKLLLLQLVKWATR